MPNVANAAILITAFLGTHTAQAADAATSTEPAMSGSAPAELHTAPPALDGAQLFGTHCVMCHKPAELARCLQSAADPEATRADMAAFLARHGRSDAAADAAIFDYLATSSAP
jgi:hypothetical protein